MKHYFYLILDRKTHRAWYSHGFFKDVEDLKMLMKFDYEILKVWEVNEEIEL